jgi:transposase
MRILNRGQTWLFPPTLDELIPDNHPARFVAAFVDNFDNNMWLKMGIDLDGDPLGAPAYNARGLMCVWLYGFMTRTRSSRKLEAACRDQIPYLWLTGWQHPDHNTLWRFYRSHRDSMRQLLKHTVHTAINLGLVDLALQAIDGTKIAANASKDRTYDKGQLQHLLDKTEIAINDLELQNETGNDPPPAYLPQKLAEAQHLRAEVKAAMEKLETEGEKRINLTDGDAKLMKGSHGILAGYNMQLVVSPTKIEDSKTSSLLITAVAAVKNEEDSGQLIPMLEQAEEITGKQADISLADAGYHSGKNLAVCEQRGQKVLMPECQERALKNPYHKEHFIYDANSDNYICPQGQTLRFTRVKRSRNNRVRQYRPSGKICRACCAFGICTTNQNHGRILEIGPYDAALRRHRKLMATQEAKELYKRRQEMPEPVFGIIKEQMGLSRFLTRGWKNVIAESTLIATAFNLRTLCKIWQNKLTEKWHLLNGSINLLWSNHLPHFANVN